MSIGDIPGSVPDHLNEVGVCLYKTTLSFQCPNIWKVITRICFFLSGFILLYTWFIQMMTQEAQNIHTNYASLDFPKSYMEYYSKYGQLHPLFKQDSVGAAEFQGTLLSSFQKETCRSLLLISFYGIEQGTSFHEGRSVVQHCWQDFPQPVTHSQDDDVFGLQLAVSKRSYMTDFYNWVWWGLLVESNHRRVL